MRRKVISSPSLLSLVLGTILSLSAIYSGIGIAKADSVIGTITVGSGPEEVAFDSFNGNLYVTNHGNNSVSVISGQTDAVIGNPIPVGSGPVGIDFDSGNGDLYVANDGAFRVPGTVSVISGQTNTVIGNPIPVGLNPWDIAFDSANGNLYVTNFSDNSVSVISGQTDAVIGNPIPVGSGPRGIAFDSGNGDLYIANEHGDSVSVISGQTNAVIGSPIAVGQQPLGIAFDSANGNLYVTNFGAQADTVSVISGQTNKVISSPIPVGTAPLGIAFDSANGNLYITNAGDNSVSVISGQTNTVIGSPIGSVGKVPLGIAFDPANFNLYVGSQNDNNVYVIATTPLQPPHTTIASAVDGNGATITNGGSTFSSSIQFTFSAKAGTNPIANFECSLDNSAFSSCSSPSTLTSLVAGKHTFQVRAVDTSGNRDPTPASFSWTIATVTPPTKTTITSAVDGNGATVQNGGTTISNSIRIAFTATQGSNPISGFQCSLDNSPFSSCSSPVALNNVAAGSHKFVVVTVDTAGNRDPTPASFSWTISTPTPAQSIQHLIQLINGMHLNSGIQAALDAQLNAILATLSSSSNNNLLSTCPRLNALTNTVIPGYLHAAQLNSNQAAQLIQAAQNIQTALGCTVASSGNGIAPSSLSTSGISSLNLTHSQQQQPQTTASSPSLLQPQSQTHYPYTNQYRNPSQHPYLFQIPRSHLPQNQQPPPVNQR